MQAMEHDHGHDFWPNAQPLVEALTELGAVLAGTTEVSDDVRNGVFVVADLVPTTPDALADVDPCLRDALLTAVIHAMRAATDDDRRELRIAVERARQAVRDLLDEGPVWTRGPKHAAYWLVHEAQLPPATLEEFVDASATTIRRWANPQDLRAPTGEQADRVVVVAKVVNHLRHAMTPRGVVRWLSGAHPALDDRRPIDELKDPDSYRALIHLASGVRSVTAS